MRRLLARGSWPLIVACLALAGCQSRAICDDGLDVTMLDMVAPEQRRSLAAAALLDACRVPEGLRVGLEHLENAVGQDGCRGALQGLDSVPTVLAAACPAGDGAVRSLATTPDGKLSLIDACELERLGVATRDELLRGAPWPCQLLGAMTYVVLRDGGASSAKALARALMLY